MSKQSVKLVFLDQCFSMKCLALGWAPDHWCDAPRIDGISAFAGSMMKDHDTATSTRGTHSQMNRIGTGLALCVVILFSQQPAAEVLQGTQAENGLLFWEWRHQGVTIRLVALLPDQTRAFFQARGFSPEGADIIARHCVFQTVFRNEGMVPVAYNLEDWRVRIDDGERPMATREVWERRWEDKQVEKSARIALNWSLLPTRQGFEPGDYNWGMTSFGLSPGARFDLLFEISQGEDSIRDSITGLICAQESK